MQLRSGIAIAAEALIRLLVWELSYTTGEDLKRRGEKKKLIGPGSSHCSSMGSGFDLEVTCSIPGLTQWVKDMVLL